MIKAFIYKYQQKFKKIYTIFKNIHVYHVFLFTHVYMLMKNMYKISVDVHVYRRNTSLITCF